MTVTKLRMTALAPTTKRGFVVGVLASLKECLTNIIGAISLGRNLFPKGAKTRFIAPRTGSSNPFPSSGESVSQRELAWRGREAGLFARMCGPCQATESAETGMAGRHRTTGDECLCWAKFQYRGAGDGSKLIAASCH